MRVDLLDNDRKTVAVALSEALSGAREAKIAMAFATGSGLNALPELKQFCARGGKLKFIAGTDFQRTEFEAVDALGEERTAACKVVWIPRAKQNRVFHPKLYLFEDRENFIGIVGSSNLTAGGLRHNFEANLRLVGSPTEPESVELKEYFDRLWVHPLTTELNEQIRKDYQLLQEQRREAEGAFLAQADVAKRLRGVNLLVADALARKPGADAHLLKTSMKNYAVWLRHGVCGDNNQRRIAALKPGTVCFFYIKGRGGLLGAMAIVVSGVYEDSSARWADGVYPYRVNLEILAKSEAPLDIAPARSELGGAWLGPGWGTRLQTSQLALDRREADAFRKLVIAVCRFDDAAA